MNRSRFRLIFLLLLGGLFINLLVAWVLAVVVDRDWLTRERKAYVYLSGPKPGKSFVGNPISSVYWELEWRVGFGAIDVASITMKYGNTPRSILTRGEVAQLIPNWAHTLEPDEVFPPSSDRHEFLARGWPCVAMCYDQTLAMKIVPKGRGIEVLWTNAQEISGGYELPSADWPSGLPRVIPLRPVWQGFIINTIFYAALIWLPLFARKRLRHYRGRCVNCAYDLRGNHLAGCPECGWSRGEVKRDEKSV